MGLPGVSVGVGAQSLHTIGRCAVCGVGVGPGVGRVGKSSGVLALRSGGRYSIPANRTRAARSAAVSNPQTMNAPSFFTGYHLHSVKAPCRGNVQYTRF